MGLERLALSESCVETKPGLDMASTNGSPTAVGTSTACGSTNASARESPAPSDSSASNDRFCTPGSFCTAADERDELPADFGTTALDEATRGADACRFGGDVTEVFDVEADPRDTNLNYYHAEARFDDTIELGSFTQVKLITAECSGGGKVELHRWKRKHIETGDDLVVVKRIPAVRAFANRGKQANERLVVRGGPGNDRHAEDQLTEIGVYCLLSQRLDKPQYLMRMHAAFQNDAEVFLILEHAAGGDMLTKVQEEPQIVNENLLRWTWQLLQAANYMHRHCIAHRDISLENVLIHCNDIKLMDFGQAVRTHDQRGSIEMRYFGTVGKPYYRSPETHVPRTAVEVVPPSEARGGDRIFVPTACGEHLCEVQLPDTASVGHRCCAEPWGYAPAIADVFSCGVCLFVMAVGAPPWREAKLADQHFKWVHRQGVAKLLQAWGRPLDKSVTELMAKMLSSDPKTRPSADSCLQQRWFEPLVGQPVPVHAMATSMAGTSRSPEEDELIKAARAAAAAGLAVNDASRCALDPYRDLAAEARHCADAHQESAMEGDFYTREEVRRCAPSRQQTASRSERSASHQDQKVLMPPPPLPLSVLRDMVAKAASSKDDVHKVSKPSSSPTPSTTVASSPSPSTSSTPEPSTPSNGSSTIPAFVAPAALRHIGRPPPEVGGGRGPPGRRPTRASSITSPVNFGVATSATKRHSAPAALQAVRGNERSVLPGQTVVKLEVSSPDLQAAKTAITLHQDGDDWRCVQPGGDEVVRVPFETPYKEICNILAPVLQAERLVLLSSSGEIVHQWFQHQEQAARKRAGLGGSGAPALWMRRSAAPKPASPPHD